jgi:hypothetical protein
LRALNVEMSDEGAERQSPITLPAESLDRAVQNLPSGEAAA